MKKNKKALWISLFSLDAAVTIFLFVVSIIMLATMPKNDLERYALEKAGAKNFIQWFQLNPTAYLFIGVIPLFILLVLNIVVLIRVIKNATAKKAVELNDLSAEQKEELRKELLNDLKEDK